jgi:hypothetical protein
MSRFYKFSLVCSLHFSLSVPSSGLTTPK